MLRKMLRFAPNVTCFTLPMDQTADFRMFATATSCLVEILKLRTRLNHVTIRGMWSFSEDELIDLVASHATTLTRLALKASTLSSGSWTSVVERLLDLQSCAMQYLELSSMNIMETVGKSRPAFGVSGWQ
jgi:flagellar motor component MotA